MPTEGTHDPTPFMPVASAHLAPSVSSSASVTTVIPDMIPGPRTVATPTAAAILRGLADPTRLRIYRLLRQGEDCVCELASELDLADNLVSHHLGTLRRLQLVRDRRDPSDSRWVYYRINTETLTALVEELGELFDPRTVGTRIPRCGPRAMAAPLQIARTHRAAPRSRRVDAVSTPNASDQRG